MVAAAFRLAVIADPHLHDVQADFGQQSGLALRPASDVVKSTRVFNETGPALRCALRDVAARGISDVVLLGDLTDDGQVASLDALQHLLDEAREWGLRFWAVPGNHDLFADTGRHRSRRMVNPAGSYDLVTSDPDRRDPGAARVRLSPRMRCLGVPDGLAPQTGFFRPPDVSHWETPFGSKDDPAARQYAVTSEDGSVTRHLMDASYLVEPTPGVWLLMIDANVWVPYGRDRPLGTDDYVDATEAGWTAMLQHKAFVFDWMADVARRAKRLGKRLLTFSHYPALDPFADSRAAETTLLGLTPLARRAPTPDAAQAVAATGIGVHFSGHLHVNATSRFESPAHWLVNVSVPSLVSFPAAYKIVTLTQTVRVQTVEIGQMPMPDIVVYPGRLAGHESYGAFLAAHARHLVARRLLRREWPADLAARVPGLTLASMTHGAMGADVPALTVIEDFHLLRLGGPFGADMIPAERLALYRASPACDPRWAPLLDMIRACLAQLPSRDFCIDAATGAVTPL
jgi:3',5'-cyclic AMP phosphodiesterase CpdA